MKKILDLDKINFLKISVKENPIIEPIEKQLPEYVAARKYLAKQMCKPNASSLDVAFCEEIINHATSKAIINLKYDKELLEKNNIYITMDEQTKNAIVLAIPMQIVYEAQKMIEKDAKSHFSKQKEMEKEYDLKYIEKETILSRFDISDKDDNDEIHLITHHSLHYLADENSEKSDVNSLQKAFNVIVDPISKLSEEIQLMNREREELEEEYDNKEKEYDEER